jgi:hypothetical protein
MSAASFHRLEGLEPDNLLAFLALLGLLRALELTRPNWRPRAYFDLSKAPLRPVLTTQSPTTQGELADASLEGLHVFRDALRPFSWPRTKQSSSKRMALFSEESRRRALSKRCISALAASRPNSRKRLIWQLRCDLLACSGARHPNPKKEGVVEPTPLKLPSAQMTFIGAQYDLIERCEAASISSCLFGSWVYAYKGHSLRLSPDEARRYAYRASDPAPEGSRTELGASALSGLGLLTFVMMDGQRRWNMVAYTGTRSEGAVFWPIWGADNDHGATLTAITALLRTTKPSGPQDSSVLNVMHMLASARRYVLDPAQGDYGNISRAELSRPER